MPIYKGDKEIATVFKGNKEVTEIFQGANQVFVSGTEAPTLAFVSKTQSTITLSVTNNDSDPITDIEISYANQTFTQGSLSIASEASQNFTITGLAINTTFNFIAIADANGKGFSEDSNTVTNSALAQVTPSIESVSAINSSTIRFRLRNNNAETTTVRYAISGSDPTTSSAGVSLGAGALSGNIDVGGQPDNSTRTIKAATFINNIKSGVAQAAVTTPQSKTATPDINFSSDTTSAMTFTLKNNDTQTATIYYEEGDSTPDQYSVSLGSGSSTTRTISGLLDGTTYTFYAQAKVSGKLDSSVDSFSNTTDRFTTAAPSIEVVETTANSIKYKVTYNDSRSGYLRHEINDSTPDIYAGGMSNGSSVTYNKTGLNTGQTYTIYARAYASRKNVSSTVSLQAVPQIDTGPGPTSVIAGNMTTGFFGEVSQNDFGIAMTSVMNNLNIFKGTTQNTKEPLLKFIHDGKVKFINKKTIRRSISWKDIYFFGTRVDVYGGTTMTFGGNSYKVRLMRGYGQVSGSTSSVTTPDFENGPLYTVNYKSGVNWPTDTSGWSANNPNEWNTLMFPIHANGSTQTQTSGVPNWANYSNAQLSIGAGFGRETWCQETYVPSGTQRRILRGNGGISWLANSSVGDNGSSVGLRLVFELI